MDTTIPAGVCNLQDTNENKIEHTYKVIQEKVIRVQCQSKTLKKEVKNLVHETALVDMKINCVDIQNKKLEEEILLLKSQTEEASCSLEDIKWKMCKIELLKEYEHQSNESTFKTMQDYKEYPEQIISESIDNEQNQTDGKNTNNTIAEMQQRLVKLKEEIETKKRNIKMTDPRLQVNTKILEKRNAALLQRYQRQLGETESRYRLTLSELNSLKRILAEKNKLLIA